VQDEGGDEGDIAPGLIEGVRFAIIEWPEGEDLVNWPSYDKQARRQSSVSVMSSEHSVSQWIAALKGREAEAAQKLWKRYSGKLVQIARQKLRKGPRAIADEEDIAQSVFHSVCRGAAAGRFGDVKNRDDLWWLLLAITKQKVVDHIRRESAKKRGERRVKSEAALVSQSQDHAFSMDSLVGDEPTPEFLVMVNEQSERLLGLLRDDRLRNVAIWRIEGYTVPEIAADLEMSTRSVERKLQLIRRAWAKDLTGAP
jgi:RNA polymerase sigma factor (sigma-70 family)